MYIDLQEYEKFRSSDFIGDNIRLLIPRKIISFQKHTEGITVNLDALICKKEPIVVSALMQARSFVFQNGWENMILQLEFLSEADIRIKLCKGNKIIEIFQPMLLKEPKTKDCFILAESDESLSLITSELEVTLMKDPYSLIIKNNSGKVLYEQYNDDLHNATQDRRRGYNEGGEDNLSSDIAKYSFPSFEIFPGGFVEDLDTGKSCFVESVKVEYNEHFYGFGERFSPIDKRGTEVLNWSINPIGVSNNKAYKPVPFFLSSKGYAAYYNTSRKIRFRMCDYFYKAYSCEIEAPMLDIFIFCHGNYKKNLFAYTALTGKSELPPKWAFGIWMSRNCYMNRDEIESVADELRAQKLPCDVLHIDWAYCKNPNFDFVFDEKRYPDVKGMANFLEEKGFKLSVWQLPYVNEKSPIYREAKERGFLAMHAKTKDGAIEAHEWVIDFSNKDAIKWYQAKLRNLLQQGIKVIKTDFGENAQAEDIYQNIDGKDMHNLYPFIYSKAAYEVCQEIHPGDSLIWGRSAYAGSQRFPVYWGGDSDSDFSGMYHSLRGGLSLGLSGFPFWSHDVGGYFCSPEPEVYIRWLQFGMMSPLVRFHGTSAREPWEFGEVAVANYRKYAKLRYSLIEYLYSEGEICSQVGLPLLRALLLDFAEDINTIYLDDQYLLGNNILVAPVFSKEKQRNVYLPAGCNWFNYHSKTWFEGGKQYNVDVPIDIIPIYFRGGTITPIVSAQQYVSNKPIQRLQWELHPDNGKANYTINTTSIKQKLTYIFDTTTGIADIEASEIEGNIEISYHINAAHVERIFINNIETGFSRDCNGYPVIGEELCH